MSETFESEPTMLDWPAKINTRTGFWGSGSFAKLPLEKARRTNAALRTSCVIFEFIGLRLRVIETRASVILASGNGTIVTFWRDFGCSTGCTKKGGNSITPFDD